MTLKPSTAVVLAAGEGRRLDPLTRRRPKPMLPVVNRPLLEHVIEAIATAGIDEVVLVVGYERDRIQTHFGDGDDWDLSISYARQDTQLGTAHAVAQAAKHVDEDFLVLNGDRIIDPSIIEDVQQTHDRFGAAATVAVTPVEDPEPYGVVEAEAGILESVIEKPTGGSPSNMINAGVYGFTSDIFAVINDLEPGPSGEYRITDAINELAASEDVFGDETQDDVRAIHYDGTWLDVSHLWDLLSVTGVMLDADGGLQEGSVADGAELGSPLHIAGTAAIGANAVIGRGSAIGPNARVGPNATVERSVVFADATIEAGAVVRDCIVGANATIEANATVAGGEGTVIVEGEVHDDVPLGGVLGDNATVGGGAVLDAGSIVGDGATLGPGVTIGGRIADGVEVQRG